MKKISFTFATAAIVFSLGIGMSFLTSCEGPAGPAGQDGQNGKDGVDANATCIQCHNDKTRVLAKMMQTSNSGHQTGTSYERSTADCAPCHTHQGYLDVLASGEMEASGDISNPVPANCRTCHMIHENYDSTDFALRTTAAVDLWINNASVDLGNSNVCVSCHQPRIPDPMPAMGGGDVTITSNRWGPHHGTQSAIVWGTAGYEVAGSVSYPESGSSATHYSAGCATCHMAEPFGAFAGGHSFNMTYDYHGHETDLVVGCQKCHSSIEDFDYHNVQTDVEALVTQLEDKLVTAGIVDQASGLVNASSSTPLVISADQAGALMNYYMVSEDRSMGIHNPPYVKALLQNSIEVFASK